MSRVEEEKNYIKNKDLSYCFLNMDKVVELVGGGYVINGAYPV